MPNPPDFMEGIRRAVAKKSSALIVHESSTHARIAAAVAGRSLNRLGVEVRYFGNKETTGNTKRFWTETIHHLPMEGVGALVLCCITWPDWNPEEQESARGVLSSLAQQLELVIALSARWPDGYASVPQIQQLLVPSDFESLFSIDEDDRHLLELMLCDRRQVPKSRMPGSFGTVDVLGALLSEGTLTVEQLATSPRRILEEASAQKETPTQAIVKTLDISEQKADWLFVEFPQDFDSHGAKILEGVLALKSCDGIGIGEWHDDVRTRFYLVRESEGDLPSIDFLLSDCGDAFGIGTRSMLEFGAKWNGPQDAKIITIKRPLSDAHRHKIRFSLQEFCLRANGQKSGNRTPPVATIRTFTTAGNAMLRGLDLTRRHTSESGSSLEFVPSRCFILRDQGNRSNEVRRTLVLTIRIASGDAGAFLFSRGGYNLMKLEHQLQGLLLGLREQRSMSYGLEGISRLRVDTQFEGTSAAMLANSMREMPEVCALEVSDAVALGLLDRDSNVFKALKRTNGRIVLYMGSETIGPSIPFALAVLELARLLDEVRTRVVSKEEDRPIRVLDLFSGSGQTARYLNQLPRPPRVVAIDLNISADQVGLEDAEHVAWLQIDVQRALLEDPPLLSTNFDIVCMDPPHSVLLDLLLGSINSGTSCTLLNQQRVGFDWLVIYQGHVTQAGRSRVVVEGLKSTFKIIQVWQVGSEMLVLGAPERWRGEAGADLLGRVRAALAKAVEEYGWTANRVEVP